MSNDFSMYAGDDKVLHVTVVDGSENIVDITGAQSIRWKMARNVNSTAILEKSLSDDVSVITPTAGLFYVTLASADTETVRPGDYYQEAELIDSAGNVATVLTGTITILPTLIKPV